MAATLAGASAAVIPPWTRRLLSPATKLLGPPRIKARKITHRSRTCNSEREGKVKLRKNWKVHRGSVELNRLGPGLDEGGDCEVSMSTEEYFTQAAVLMKSTRDGGGPRWFSPVECGRPVLKGAPLLLYLPGIDGVGLGLAKQHRKLGRIFETWCLHIPVMDRTPFAELVNLAEAVIRSEHNHSPKRPIYLIGESFGGCLALAIASRNADIDLVLILANPATSFANSALTMLSTSQLKLLVTLSESALSKTFDGLPFDYSKGGDPTRLLMSAIESTLGQSRAAKDLVQGLHSLSSYYSVVAEIFSLNTFLWRIEMLKNACDHANSRLHDIESQTLVLASGLDQLLPSLEEGERLCSMMPNCKIRKFYDKGHLLFLEDGVDLVYTIKGAILYRRGRSHDFVSDFLPPTPSEFKRFQDRYWWYHSAASPVLLSTLENGTIVRGLAGVPSEGPTLLVGYHMLMGIELTPLATCILVEKNIVVRGLGHPMLFQKQNVKLFPELSELIMYILMGAVPVSGANLFNLLESKSHVLLYPGGGREALHRKGEEYQLFWPEEPEFVRMAARFGAKIVPFGAVGEDDLGELVFDYNDVTKIPYLKATFETLEKELGTLRTQSTGEVSNQKFHIPGILPKVPGRLYYLFGKPIETQGRGQALHDRHNARKLYLEVKSEVEKCLAFLKEKREIDPYRSIMSRLLYLSTHTNKCEIPTFKL